MQRLRAPQGLLRPMTFEALQQGSDESSLDDLFELHAFVPLQLKYLIEEAGPIDCLYLLANGHDTYVGVANLVRSPNAPGKAGAGPRHWEHMTDIHRHTGNHPAKEQARRKARLLKHNRMGTAALMIGATANRGRVEALDAIAIHRGLANANTAHASGAELAPRRHGKHRKQKETHAKACHNVPHGPYCSGRGPVQPGGAPRTPEHSQANETTTGGAES